MLPKIDELNIVRCMGVTIAKEISSDDEFYNQLATIVDTYHKNISQQLAVGYTSVSLVKNETTDIRITTSATEPVLVVYQEIGDVISVNNEHYSTSAVLTHTALESRQILSSTDHTIRMLVQTTKLIVFDIPNMVKHMKMDIDQINNLALVFNSYGLTTIGITESSDGALVNVAANILIDIGEHDDIIELLYSMIYGAVIITNDTHKEFNELIHFCKTHNKLMLRHNESCPQKNHSCSIRVININKPRYMSIQKCVSGYNKLNITYDLPLIRFKSYKKKRDNTHFL